jgi:hypothetical protein
VSGGHNFNVSDLTAVARASHIFLALDGFDEVADIALRQQLVDEITKGVNRLVNAGGFSVRTIVTSRPAAFAKSVRFPREQWSYYELLPLERRHVDGYTTKWMKAKGLKEGEKVQLRRILDSKLKETHTQYLSKNPMQLTILLSLVHNRGASLPEKRTAMYDAYMDMFFSRESEKSDVVRDNRDLLIDIHRYLAWKLQSGAEAGGSGSIEHSELRTTLFGYLDREEEDTSIVNALFNGIIERVGALVSRVQDTYEFEVQPLREYFAARHLYETAPYPIADNELIGDKFARFNALIRNPYWLNVARFYGGCFNKGELLTLANELIEFGNQGEYRLTSHPRTVGLMLLGDWVFTKYQPAVKRVISFVGDYPQLRQLLANSEEAGASRSTALPERNGRAEFLDILWALATKVKHADERRAVCNAIVLNSSVEDSIRRWEAVEIQMSHAAWVRLGTALNVFGAPEVANSGALKGPLSEEIIDGLIEARRFDYLEHSDRVDAARLAILNRAKLANVVIEKPTANQLVWLAATTSAYQYVVAARDESAMPLLDVLESHFGTGRSRRKELDEIKLQIGELSEGHRDTAAAYVTFLETQTSITSTSPEPWRRLVETLRSAWGDCAAIDRIAFVGAGVRSKEFGGIDGQLNSTTDLVGCVRYARLKSGAPRWWEARLKSESDSAERKRLLLLISMWATPTTLIKMSSFLDEMLFSLDTSSWLDLNGSIQCLAAIGGERDVPEQLTNRELLDLKRLTSRTCAFVGQRLSKMSQYALAIAVATSSSDIQMPEKQFALKALLVACREKSQWKAAAPHIRYLYGIGASPTHGMGRGTEMPENIARQIAESAEDFPLSLNAIADSQLQSGAGASAQKLLEVAKQEKWFIE